MVQAARPASRPVSSISSAADEGRFPPGTLLLERYRIVALLGRGGMGEVYRATDLKLGQSVALKFLPETSLRDERALARFHDEVRIARQVSHPNVCRVYDIGEIEGQQFLSMEYVDGEDLGSLLRRIGRIPSDKALEIARKVCAGLAAAHDKGVLHRNLKPANVMLDGRGNALITDFGLAALSGQVKEGEIRHGTPAYMAPEQLAGKEVTVRSDIYALGLLLYEVFAGRRAFEAGSMADLMKLQATGTPASMVTLAKDIDPAVERVILRCLAPDPRNRPVSALAVAAALPGGDPVAAALAAGETPSPDMVAASGETEGLRPRTAMALLASVLVALIGLAALCDKTSLYPRIPFENTPEALAVRASWIFERLGYARRGVGEAGDFNETDYLTWLPKFDRSNDRWKNLGSGQPALAYYWVRHSPRYFDPGYDLRVFRDRPPMEISGEVQARLDTTGRLMYFTAVPPQVDDAKGPPRAADWNVLFGLAGLDPAKFQSADPQWTPPTAFDARAAWTGAYPSAPKIALRVEAASWRGKPVYFELISPWTQPARMKEEETSARARFNDIVTITILCVLMAGAALLARWNSKLKRSDTRGAARLGAFVLAVYTLQKMVAMYHAPNSHEFGLFTYAVSSALYSAAVVWMLYLAVEPFVRRRWPQTIVSWSRILGGKLRDPLVGADILIGVAFGLFWTLLIVGAALYGMSRGEAPTPWGIGVLSGARAMAGGFLGEVASSITFAFGVFLLLFLFRLALRKDWLAAAAFVAIFVAIKGLLGQGFWNIPLVLAIYGVLALLLLRYGIVPLIVAVITTDSLLSAPLTLDFSAWYITSSLASLLLFLGIAAYGFRCTVAGKKLFELE